MPTEPGGPEPPVLATSADAQPDASASIRQPSAGLNPPPSDDLLGAASPQPPLVWREVVAVFLLIVLADVTIYRGAGFAGYALFFLAAPAILLLGAPRPSLKASFWILASMLVLLAAKMLWCGSWLLAVSGLVLVVGFAMALSGLIPYVLEVVVFASQTILAGYEGLSHYRHSTDRFGPTVSRGTGLSIGLPVAAFVAFSLLFIVANPDLLASFGETMEWLMTGLRDWILQTAPSWHEILFWLAVMWISVGLLRPVVSRARSEPAARAASTATQAAPSPGEALLYLPFRNTLVTVIVLFAVYLTFEFQTLWFRVFPDGFHYSGYAHEGAAWLTVALGLTTVILSLIFRGRVLADPRLGRLRWLAWVWSLENVLLVAAVYHRMLIYVEFNGMTRMRTVGIFGISCVVAGFVLVIWKITHQRDFTWLLRRHLWALALTVYLFALTPVDALVHRHNVRRILSGDPAPSVQISVHPINSEGVLELLPLVDCDDELIREGVRAMLADRLGKAESLARRRQREGWTTYQIADQGVLDGLRASQGTWAEYTNHNKRQSALREFHEYAYQWY